MPGGGGRGGRGRRGEAGGRAEREAPKESAAQVIGLVAIFYHDNKILHIFIYKINTG